jgi:sensor histidine kinase regulating citrate/malate metabolism
MNNLKLGVKSLDLTKVLGNLIDNAIDEVSLLPEEKRIVTVSGCQHSGVLEFKVSNSCSDIEALRNKPLFDAGYSSKDKTHSGLGLSIVKSIVGRYKGTVRMELTEPDIVTFVVRIPH